MTDFSLTAQRARAAGLPAVSTTPDYASLAPAGFGDTEQQTALGRAASGVLTKQAELTALGGDPAEGENEGGFLHTVVNILGRPRSAVIGLGTGLLGMESKDEEDGAELSDNPLKRMWQGLSGTEIHAGDFGALHREDDDTTAEKWLKITGGFAWDVLLDPLTYATFGTGTLGRQGAAVAAEGFSRTKLPEILAQVGSHPEAATKLAALKDGHITGLIASKSAGATDDASVAAAKSWVDGLIQHKGAETLVARHSDELGRGAADAFRHDGLDGLRRHLLTEAGGDAAQVEAKLAATGLADAAKVTDAGETAMLVDAFATGAAHQVTKRATRGLREYYKTHLGDDLGEQLFKSAPSQLRGGIGLRAPFIGENVATGQTTLRLPFGNPDVLPKVFSVGGGGRILEKVPGGTRAADLANLGRLGVQASAPVRFVGDKINGVHSELYGRVMRDNYTDEAARLLGAGGRGTDLYRSVLRDRVDAKAAAGGRLGEAATRLGRTLPKAGPREGVDDLARTEYAHWAFARKLANNTHRDTAMLAAADQRALGDIGKKLAVAEQHATREDVKAFTDKLFNDRRGFFAGKYADDTLEEWQKPLATAVRDAFGLFDSWGSRLVAAGVPAAEVDEYMALIATNAYRDLAKRQKSAGASTPAWDGTHSRDSWGTVLRDDAGEVVVDPVTGVPTIVPRSAADINAELVARGEAPRFEEDMMKVLSTYGVHANRLASQAHVARAVATSGLVLPAELANQLVGTGFPQLTRSLATFAKFRDANQQRLRDEQAATKAAHDAFTHPDAVAARAVENDLIRDNAEAAVRSTEAAANDAGTAAAEAVRNRQALAAEVAHLRRVAGQDTSSEAAARRVAAANGNPRKLAQDASEASGRHELKLATQRDAWGEVGRQNAAAARSRDELARVEAANIRPDEKALARLDRERAPLADTAGDLEHQLAELGARLDAARAAGAAAKATKNDAKNAARSTKGKAKGQPRTTEQTPEYLAAQTASRASVKDRKALEREHKKVADALADAERKLDLVDARIAEAQAGRVFVTNEVKSARARVRRDEAKAAKALAAHEKASRELDEATAEMIDAVAAHRIAVGPAAHVSAKAALTGEAREAARLLAEKELLLETARGVEAAAVRARTLAQRASRKATAEHTTVSSDGWLVAREAAATGQVEKYRKAAEAVEAELARDIYTPTYVHELTQHLLDTQGGGPEFEESVAALITTFAEIRKQLGKAGKLDAADKGQVTKSALMRSNSSEFGPAGEKLGATDGLSQFRQAHGDKTTLSVHPTSKGYLENTFAPTEMMKVIEAYYKPMSVWDNKLWDSFIRPYMTVWKTWATVGRGPGFTARNLLGGFWTQLIHGLDGNDIRGAAAIVKVESLAARQALKEARRQAGATRGKTLKYDDTSVSDEWVFNRTEEIIRQKLAGRKFGRHSLLEIWEARNQQSVVDYNSGHDVFFAAGRMDADQAGVAFQQLAKGEADNSLRLAGKTGVGDVGVGGALLNKTVDNFWIRGMSHPNQLAERYLRTMAFVRGTREFGLADGGVTAAQLSRLTQFSYSDMTEFEARWVKLLIPFYAYSRGSIPLHVRTMVARPGRFNELDAFADGLKAGLGTDDPLEAGLPINDTSANQDGFVSKFHVDGMPISLQLPLPAFDLNTLLGPNGVPKPQGAFGQSNPLLKSIAGAAMGVDPATGQAYNPDGVQAPIMARALGKVPGVGGAFDIHTNTEGETVGNAALISALRNLTPGYSIAENGVLQSTPNAQQRGLTSRLSLLTGLPAQTLTPEQETGLFLSSSNDLTDAIHRRQGDLGIDPEKYAKAKSKYGLDGVVWILQNRPELLARD